MLHFEIFPFFFLFFFAKNIRQGRIYERRFGKANEREGCVSSGENIFLGQKQNQAGCIVERRADARGLKAFCNRQEGFKGGVRKL